MKTNKSAKVGKTNGREKPEITIRNTADGGAILTVRGRLAEMVERCASDAGKSEEEWIRDALHAKFDAVQKAAKRSGVFKIEFSFDESFAEVPTTLLSDEKGRLYLGWTKGWLMDKAELELPGDVTIPLRDATADLIGKGLEEITPRRALEWFAAGAPYSSDSSGDIRLACRLAAEQLAALGR